MSEIKLSSSEKELKLTPINIDTNQLFSLSYTFDNLKLLINTLLENQNLMYAKIKDLENNIITEKEDSQTRINMLEKKIKTITLKKEYKENINIPVKKFYGSSKNISNGNNINLQGLKPVIKEENITANKSNENNDNNDKDLKII